MQITGPTTRLGVKRVATDVPNRPAVSVIVPLYNKRATIARTVDSILAQTHADFELIIVDDGSTDDGADLVERQYDDARIRVVRQTNAGPGAARNRGVELAQAPLISFLDADDEWCPTFLETALATLAAHPDCAAFTASFLIGREPIDRWEELRAYGFVEGPWRLTPDIPRDDLRLCQAAFSSSSAVYRREAVEAYGGFYTGERCTFGEDLYLWIQILLNHAIYRHMEPLAHYHTEDSDLGIGAREGRLPLEPIMTRPAPIRAACPPQLADTLELWLAQHAARVAFMQLDRGDRDNAAWLMREFPRIRDWRSDHLKLRLRLTSPALWSFARQVGRVAVGAGAAR